MSNNLISKQSVLAFDGIDDNLTFPKGFPTIDKAITIEFWAKGENSLKHTTNIFNACNAQGNRLANVHLPWAGQIFWDAGDENGSYDRINKIVKLKEYNVWIHWTFVKDVTTGKMLIYRQGEIWHQGEGQKKSLAGIEKFIIGCYSDYSLYWKGSLTEFRIWNVARTPEEIQQNMNSRLTGNEPGLVGYYPLNGDSNDKTSNANHGIINGAIWKQEELPLALEPAITSDKAGILQFDGQDDSVNLGKKSAFKIEKNLTIEAWIYAEEQKEWAGILSNIFDTGLTESGYGLLLDGKSGIYLGLEPIDQPLQNMPYLSSGANTLNLNQWHHVAGTYNGEQMKVYIDGVEKATLAVSPSAIKYSSENDLLIGMYKDDNEFYAFKGKIAEVRLWNRTRSAEEIKADMNRYLVGNEAGLVGYWSLNEGFGNLVTDKTSQGNNGTINGAIWKQEELPIQEAISAEIESNVITGSNTPTTDEIADSNTTNNSVLAFDGIDDNLTIPKGFSTIDKAITIEFWAKGENSLSQQTSVIEAHNSQNTRVLNVHFPWQHVANSRIFWDAGNENGYDRIDKEVKLEEYNSWTNWAFVKDTSTGKMFIYRNGEIWHQGEGNTKKLSGIQKFVIASYVNGGQYWKGSLTEFRIWNIARTPEEIQQNMNSRLTGNEWGLVGYYPLNGDSNDKTSNANHGIINGAIWQEEELPIQTQPSKYILTAANLLTDSKIKLKSWKGDYLHRPDTAQDVTTWSTGVGNEWTVEALGDNKIKLKSWKGDYLHRPDTAQGVTTWSTGVGNEWTVEALGDNKIKLKSWKGDYLHRPDTAQGVTTWSTGVGNEWELELISITNVEPINFPEQANVLSFDGIDDYIKLPDGILTASYTKEAWIKLTEPAKAESNILSGNQHALYVPNAIAAGHNGQWAMVQTPQPCPKNTWLHVALTYDSQTRIMCLYQDGQLVSQASNIPPFDPGDRTLDIGIYRNGYFFKGEIAEARIWNFARTQEMIQKTMSSRLTGQETGLAAYYPLNEGSGNVATDKTGKGNNGKINGAIWQQEELPIKDVTSSENESNVITGGNTPTKYGIADSASNFYLVDTNNPVDGNGELTEWEIWAENTLPVQLMIYRKEADIWSVVGKSEVKTPVVGLNQFSLSEPIKVNKGDFVGIYHPQAGCVSFFKENSAAWAIGNLSGTFLFTGSGANSTAFSNSSNRIYSLRVKGNVQVATQPPVSKFLKIGTKGGSISGTDFELLPEDTAPKSRLKSVSMNVAWAISRLQVEYENLASTPVQTYLTAIVGSGGGQRKEVSIQPGDYLTKISGTWGRQAPGYPKEEIITIQFETKQGIKSPIFGGESGKTEVEPFVLEAPEGQEIIGFFGSHGGPQDLLVRLGIYCQPISIPENQQPTESVQPTESSVTPENQQPTEPVQPTESSVTPENQQPTEPVQPTESSVTPENQQPTESVQPTESSVSPKNQQPSQPVLKLRKGFSFDEAILMATLSKYAYDVFQRDDGSVDDVELKTVYKALYKNQEWELVHTFRNDDTNIRGLIFKNTQSAVAHQYAVSLRGTSVNDKDTVNLDNIVSDVDWKLIDYGSLAVQKAKVVQGLHLAFESVADEIQYFFKTLRGELKPSDFRRLNQLPSLRKFACITALANAGAIRMGVEFEQQAQDLVAKVVADGEIDNDEELEKILQFVEEQLLSKKSPLTEPIEVWVTGYSLGAALCQLAGLSLRRWFGSASSGGLLIKVYAIASPKIGNQAFIDFYNKQIGAELCYRIENALDIVPTYPYDPPFPIGAIAPEGIKLGNTYIGKYANGGEAITVMGFGSGQSGSISLGGLFNIPFSVPFPHSPETYIELLEEQQKFWSQLARPVKNIARPFLLELLRDQQR